MTDSNGEPPLVGRGGSCRDLLPGSFGSFYEELSQEQTTRKVIEACSVKYRPYFSVVKAELGKDIYASMLSVNVWR